MNAVAARIRSREEILHALYEAAELEHNLMCTYLYAAFSLRDCEAEGLRPGEVEVVRRWRSELLKVSVEEMGHLTAVWNITSALGGTPRFGRGNFPLEPGNLPASVTVRLAPFNQATLQHFIFLERPKDSTECDGDGFAYAGSFRRGNDRARITPMSINYDTVGDFYAALSAALRDLVARETEDKAFDGDPAVQLSPNEVGLPAAKPVICLKTALAAFDAIVVQGEGAPRDATDSHYQRFGRIRAEYRQLLTENPDFTPAFPAATNPVLREPPRPEGRVWIEDPEATAVVDLANAAYGLMVRLLAYAYVIRGPQDEKSLAVDLAVGLMRAITPLAERAARLPAGPSNPGCNAGMSFTALRDAAPLAPGRAARRLFLERLECFTRAANELPDPDDPRVRTARDQLAHLYTRAVRGFEMSRRLAGAPAAPRNSGDNARDDSAVARAGAAHDPQTTIVDGVETVRTSAIELQFEGRRCIHARFCVTGAPQVFLANVKGPWIHPEAMPVPGVVEIAHLCPSGAIRYRRLDGGAQEQAPPVNLVSIREAGPYAFRAPLLIDGEERGYRATLCRCGASRQKPFCDGSHHEVGFAASGEPPTTQSEPTPQVDGPLAIDPQPDGPLAVRGNLQIISGTGRVVARTLATNLCRCGGSASKPFCDGTHARIGFRSDR
ncbi:MAG TPA: ferritin-like domain-containing protein [Steroidobacteraceae bacterium]|nr:ferritin-like domain-containing protein [Steroidobacteraceae bacterium]